MKVLVTGATGFLGQWLTQRLLDEGFEVRILVRSKAKLDDFAPTAKVGAAVDIAEGDVTHFDTLVEACKGVEGVFHLAGLIAYSRAQRQAMESVNVGGTRNVIRAIQKNGSARMLHLSSVTSVGAGFTPSEILDESSTYNIHHLNLGYFETKHEAEKLVLSACARGELDAVCINPSTIYGPGDAKKGSRSSQLKVARGELPFYPPGGVNVVHVDDVVDLCIKAFRHGAPGERTIACGENLLIQDVFEQIARIAGVVPPRFGLPRSAIFGLGAVGSALEWVGLKGPLNLENAWTAVLYHWFRHDKASRDFGFKPRPAHEALEASVRWSRDQGLC